MEDLIVVIEESLPSIVVSAIYADTNVVIPPNTNTNSLGSLTDVNTPFAQDGQVLTFQSGEWVAESITDESTPTLLQWGIAYDGTAVSLATVDSASTKAPRRVPLGCQSLPVGLAVGGNVPDLCVDFRQPLAVNAGNYLHVILKIPVGTATASQIIRGVVTINATWE